MEKDIQKFIKFTLTLNVLQGMDWYSIESTLGSAAIDSAP